MRIIWSDYGKLKFMNKTRPEGSGQAKPESNVETRRNLSNYLYDVGRLLLPYYVSRSIFLFTVIEKVVKR